MTQDKLYSFDINGRTLNYNARLKIYSCNSEPYWYVIGALSDVSKKELLKAYYSVAPIWKDTINYKGCVYYVEYNPDTCRYWYDIKDRVANDDIIKYDKNWLTGESIVKELRAMIDDTYADSIPMGDSIYLTSDSKAICQCDLNEVFRLGHEYNCPEENVRKRKPAN